jgi:hypothetical protein
MQWPSFSETLNVNTRLHCNVTNTFSLFSHHPFTVSCSKTMTVTNIKINAKQIMISFELSLAKPLKVYVFKLTCRQTSRTLTHASNMIHLSKLDAIATELGFL